MSADKTGGGKEDRVVVVAAPFGGPVMVVRDGLVSMRGAAGQETACWKWKSSRIVTCNWSVSEEAVFVVEDGSVLLYDLFGRFIRTFSMGREAKDLKVSSAVVFRSRWGTGVAVLTTAKRFFIVNNADDPRIRKLPDVELTGSASGIVWNILADERHAKVVVAGGNDSNGSAFIVSSQSQGPESLPMADQETRSITK